MSKHEIKPVPKTTYPEGNWKRKTSYAMGEYLKMDDEVLHATILVLLIYKSDVTDVGNKQRGDENKNGQKCCFSCSNHNYWGIG